MTPSPYCLAQTKLPAVAARGADEAVGGGLAFRAQGRRAGPSGWSFLRRGLVAGATLLGLAAPARAQSGHFRTQPQSQFVQIGQTVTLSATLGGGQPTFQWQKNGAPLPGATTGSLTVTVASAADAGSYTLVVSDRAGSETSAPALLYLSRLANFSVRATLSPAAPSVTLGHGIVGRGSVVLLRAIGPGLGQFGVRDGLADPRLTVLRTLPASSNSGWSAAPDAARVADEARRLGAFALAAGSADAALYSAVEGTVFSAEAVSASNATGAVLLELYHADPAPTNRLVNVSARARLGARDDRIAAGFVLAGQARTTLLIRAVGPSLAAFGLSGALAAPRLELIRAGSGEVLVRNDQWAGGAELRAAFAAAGAFPLAAADSKDAALLVTLEPGAYSAQLTGVDGALGDALVELYVLP